MTFKESVLLVKTKNILSIQKQIYFFFQELKLNDILRNQKYTLPIK